MSTRHHPFSTALPSINDTAVVSTNVGKGGSGKTSSPNALSFEEEAALREGKPQRKAVAFINNMMESGRPLYELKEYFMQTLGYDAGNPEHILQFEALLVDRFAMALSFEHDDVASILAYMRENEAEIFPEGLASYELYKKAEGFYEVGQRGGKFHPLNVTHNPDDSLRDLDALNRYLQVRWDEYIPFMIHDDKLDVISQLASKGFIDRDTLTYNILPFSGEKASRLRMAIHGADIVTVFEADERLGQVVIGAFPALSQKMHLIGSKDHLKALVNDIHLPELAKAPDYLSKWAIHSFAKAMNTLSQLEMDWNSRSNDGAQTKEVFTFLKARIPELYKHLGSILCDKPVGLVAEESYTEASFALDMFRQILKRAERNPDGTYKSGIGKGHFHYYLPILELVDSSSFDDFHKRLSSEELLLAFQITRHKPLLKHLSAQHRDLAFNSELGL